MRRVVTLNHVRVEQIANILEKIADTARPRDLEALRRDARWLRRHINGENEVVVELTRADLASNAVFYKGFLQSGILEKLKAAGESHRPSLQEAQK